MNHYLRVFFLISIIFLNACAPKKEPIYFSLNTPGGVYESKQDSGKVLLVYFGFLSCPDFCPNTLQTLSTVLNSLVPENRKNVRLIFIDVDPERDTPENIKKYLDFFYPGIIGLTGTIPELKTVAGLFHASFEKVQLESKMGYTIDHSTSVYVVNAHGFLSDTIPHGTNLDVIKIIIQKQFQ